MASYITIEDRKHVEDGYVVDVTIRQTEAEKYPSGWDYALHLGEVGGDTVLRYLENRRFSMTRRNGEPFRDDNAHERTKGHERHTRDGVDSVEFPGMLALYDRFKREVEGMTSISWPE